MTLNSGTLNSGTLNSEGSPEEAPEILPTMSR